MLRQPDEDAEEGLPVGFHALDRCRRSGPDFIHHICITCDPPCLLRLLEYLQAMRKYFLLEAGDTMYDFYTAIFDKMQEKESWQQLSFLNIQLQEAVGQRHPEDSSRYCMYFIQKVITMATK